MSPEDLKYTAEHEWVRPTADGAAVRVGITDYAQEALGDIVFVTLPDLGAEVTPGTPCGEVESTKSVSDIYAPLAGEVTARNEDLTLAPSWSTPTRTATAGCSRCGRRTRQRWTACSTHRPTRRPSASRFGRPPAW